MFKIEMLQAGWGDCLWIEYGDSKSPRRILIDGGITLTYKIIKQRILALPEDQRHFDLFVITHIDADHIEGAVKLLGRIQELKVTFGDIWFNGYEHLQELEDDRLGGIQGEFLSALIKSRKLNWNKAFEGKAVVVSDKGDLPVKYLGDNLKITILSPTRETLKNLIPAWDQNVADNHLGKDKTLKEVLDLLEKNSKFRPEEFIDDRLGEPEIDVEGLAESFFDEDETTANGSSIAFLLEYDDPEDKMNKSCLLTGDAHPSVLSSSLMRLVSEEKSKIKLNLLKVSHHGSKNNTSKEFLKLIDCQKFLFSSNGKKYSHPDSEAIARILFHFEGENVPQLYFNYLSEFNKIWNNSMLINGDYPYLVKYADDNKDGILINL